MDRQVAVYDNKKYKAFAARENTIRREVTIEECFKIETELFE
ncbi:hypothetical protein [Neobacillus jeddahensis]|nr:hypothetical protein [Neobacillus jeddahensis]